MKGSLRKFLSVLLVFCLMAAVAPAGTNTAWADTVSVTTEGELRSSVTSAAYSEIIIGGDITLTGDLSINRDVTLTSANGSKLDAGAYKITIPAGKTVTFNGNLAVTGSGTSVVVEVSGSFTLDGNASVIQTGPGTARAIHIKDSGTVLIEDGTVESAHTGIRIETGTGTVTVNGGSITGGTYAIDSYGTVKINNGTVGSASGVQNGGVRIMGGGTADISGGSISGSSSSGGDFAVQVTGTANISGGSFSGRVATTSSGSTINIDRSLGSSISFSDGVRFYDSQYRAFLTALPAVPVSATQGAQSTVSLTGAYNGVTFAVDGSTAAALNATATGSGGTAAVNMTPTAAGSYKLVLTAVGTGTTTPQNLKLTLPVTVTASSLTPLAAPTGLGWDITTPGKAQWNTVTGAAGYSVQLYKGGTAEGSPVSVASGTLEHDFTAAITATGTYTFKVIAVGNGTTNSDSPESAASPGYSYTAPTVVCEISTTPSVTPYTSLDAALAAVLDGQTITMKKSINHPGGITIDSGSPTGTKTVILNLNGYALNVGNAGASWGIKAQNGGRLELWGTGQLNVTAQGNAVEAVGAGSFIEVTKATSTHNIAAFANTGGEIVVSGDAEGAIGGVYAQAANSKITVGGKAAANASNGIGASALGGIVTVTGDAAGISGGAYASGAGSVITVSGDAEAAGADGKAAQAVAGGMVNAKNALATGINSIGASAMGSNSKITITENAEGQFEGAEASNSAEIIVHGNVTTAYTGMGKGIYATGPNTKVTVGHDVYGRQYGVQANDSAEITVKGNVSTDNSGSTFAYGVWARDKAKIKVDGNVSSNNHSGSIGAYAQNTTAGSVTEITVDGTISGQTYIQLNNAVKDDNPTHRTTPSPKTDYHMYTLTDSAGTHTVWVKDTTAPAGTTGNPVWSGQSPLPTSSRILNMKVLNGKFWAVGENGTLLKSEEGVNWEKIKIGNPANLFRLEGITYGEGTYMLVGRLDEYASAIYTSPDGTTWTEKAAIPHNLRDVAYGDGKFVAVGRPGKIMVSEDHGATWQTIVPVYPVKKSYYLQSITYAAGKFVAVGMGSDTAQNKGGIMTSADGVNWEFPYTDANNYIWDVAYGGSSFVAVGGRDTGAPFIRTSADGTTWTAPNTGALTYSTLYAVEYANSKFVAAGRTNTGNYAYTATSTNGAVWSDGATGGGLSGFNTLASDGTSWVATNGMGSIYKSNSGQSPWDYMTKGSTNTLNDVAYNGSGLYVAVGDAGTIQTSGDGVDWTIQTSGTTQNLNKVDYLGGQFIAVGRSGTILTSFDGTVWTSRASGTLLELKGIAYDGSGKYVVVGGDGSWARVILTSADAAVWTPVNPGNINVSLNTVAFGDGVFITLTKNGAAFSSADGGVTWTAGGSFSGYPSDLIYAGGKFAAVGTSGEVNFSTNKGASWSSSKSDFDRINRSIAYGGGNFIIVGELGNIMASADGGVTWYRQPSGLEQNPHSSENNLYTDLNGVTAGNSCFVAVGAGGLVLKSDMTAVSDNIDAHDVAVAKTALGVNRIIPSGESVSRITRNMPLITKLSSYDLPSGITNYGALDVVISWQSSKPTVISSNGNVTRPAFEEGDQVVYLTATFTKSTASDTKTFIVRVLANEYVAPLTDAQRVAAAKAALGDGTVTVAAGADQAAKTAAVQSYVNSLLAAVPDAEGVTAIVTYNSVSGEYDVALTKGSANDSRSLDINIIESPDPDLVIVGNALTAVENATYGNISQAAASSEAAIKAALRAIAITALNNSGINVALNKINYTLAMTDTSTNKEVLRDIAATALNNSSVNVTVNTVSYLAPVAGTSANPSGTNGSYTFTVTVSKGSQSQTTTQKTITIGATAYSSSSSGGGGGGSSAPAPKTSIISDVVETAADKAMDKVLIEEKKAVLSLAGGSSNTVQISAAVIARLAEHETTFALENTGVRLDFAPGALSVAQVTGGPDGALVEIGAREVTGTEREGILAQAPAGQSTGLFEIGGRIFDLTALVRTGEGAGQRIEGFGAPVAVTIDLSHLGDLTPEQISQLTGVRLEKDDQGNIVPVILGGQYDPATRTFTFNTDTFSLYTVMRLEQAAQRLVVELAVGSAAASVNGSPYALDAPPRVAEGRTLVPVRFVSEALGAKVTWDAAARRITVTDAGKVIVLTLGSGQALVDGKARAIDCPPATLPPGRAFVPLRFVSETLGAQVDYDNKQITITR